VSVDINGYYNIYNDFIGNLNVVAPYYGTAQDNPSTNPGSMVKDGSWFRQRQYRGDFRVYQLYTNTDVEIQSLGFGLGLSKSTEILKWVLITTMLNLNLTKQGSKF
jgi:hypothetical protein